MSPSPIAPTPALAVSVRPRLSSALHPLFDRGNPYLPALGKPCQKIPNLAAVHANELWLAIKHSSLSRLCRCALLYSISDPVGAYLSFE